MTRQHGFTLIEILTVMVIVGIVVSMAIPRFGNTMARQNVRGARGLITTMHARARAAAVYRGRRTTLLIKNGVLLIRSQNPVTAVLDTVGRTTEDVVSRFGVTYTVQPSRDSLVFDARGVGTWPDDTTAIIVSKSGYADTVVITKLGRILH